MKKDELIELLQRQIDFLQGKLDVALSSVSSLTLANEKLIATVEELRKQIISLEDVVKGKGAELSKEKAARKAVQRLQGSSSEMQAKPIEAVAGQTEQKPQRKRTNNGAKEKLIRSVRLKLSRLSLTLLTSELSWLHLSEHVRWYGMK
ncbi:hypothetical protein [Parabacteroides chongii]|uniref:hypothetical protein n=1 Tax=Parabacteroides chongii TaxID=2685834 RepID=UPI00240E8277|nr:hypothetical protein [Parabacteroides chongii]WFE85331.1 hypothetical protein P3L47_01700 [Parabacteroides chongii]